MRVTFIVIAVIFLCSNCSNLFEDDEYYYLPDNYKTDLQESDTLVFDSEKGSIERFIVKNIIKSYHQWALSGANGKGPYSFDEFEYIMINNVNDSFDTFGYNQIISQADGNYGEGAGNMETSNDTMIIGVRLGTRNWYDISYAEGSKDYIPQVNWYKQKFFTKSKIHETINIGEKDYYNVIEFAYPSGIKTIFYDYKKGILKYIDNNDETWIRIN